MNYNILIFNKILIHFLTSKHVNNKNSLRQLKNVTRLGK